MSSLGVAVVASKWDAEVAELTRDYRETRAKHLTIEGKRRRRDEQAQKALALEAFWVAQGEPPPKGRIIPHVAHETQTGQWHLQRARGQRERFERVEQCQKLDAVEIMCGRCGEKTVRAARCRVALVCTSCRGKISREKQAKLWANHEVAVRQCKRAGLLNPHRPDRWSQKLATFTVPHVEGMDIRGRIEFLRDTLRAYQPRFRKWLRKAAAQHAGLARWARHAEWEESSDGMGHPHVHYWLLGPFVPFASAADAAAGRHHPLKVAWRLSLRDAARKWPEEVRARVEAKLSDVVIDIRAAYDKVDKKTGKKRRGGAIAEIVKYLFKDLTQDKERLRPEVWAEVFKAFDGTRTTQGSARFMSLAQRSHGTGKGARCKCCGAAGEWRVRRKPLDDAMRRRIERMEPAKRSRVVRLEGYRSGVPPPKAETA